MSTNRSECLGTLLVCMLMHSVCSAAVQVPPPSRLHYVQVAAVPTTDTTRLATLQSMLGKAGWGPVTTTASATAGLIAVRVGEFETALDAEWYKQSLREQGYPDAFKVATANPTGAAARGGQGPVKTAFRAVTAADLASAGTGVFDKLRPALTPAQCNHLDRFLSEEPEANTATEADALLFASNLQLIADGQARASKQEVCRARIAIAHNWHYSWCRRWPLSYQCYGEALSLAAPGSKEEAECLVQRAALIMQLARSQKGDDMEACRRACATVSSRVSESDERAHAVAGLMAGESYFFENKYAEAVRDLLLVQQRWPKRWREVAMAQVFAGISYVKMDKLDDGERLLRAVYTMHPSGNDLFKWHGNPRELETDAAEWLLHISVKKRQPDQIRFWAEYLSARSSSSADSSQESR